MKALICSFIVVGFTSSLALAQDRKVTDDEPLKVQTDLRPPTQKFTQQVLENKVRDNLFKKEEKEEKEAEKKL